MAVARILLGVTGGIAAYKACDTAGEPMVPPRAPSFTERGCDPTVGSAGARSRSARAQLSVFDQESS